MFTNCVLQGDCTKLLQTLPKESVDLVVTDPPYFVRYKDRLGRTIANDDYPESVIGAFTYLYKVLKPNTFCISFYGWNRVDAFFRAWQSAGFRPVGHIVWKKNYASSSRYLRACHEQAYLLAKGNPQLPTRPLDDVRAWEYTGNKLHPTEKSVNVLRPLIQSFSRPGDLVLDPFAGSGSTLVAAATIERRYLGIELEEKYCDLIKGRLSRIGLRSAPKNENTRSSDTEDAVLGLLQWLIERNHNGIAQMLSGVMAGSYP